MSYLTIPKGIPNFTKAVISLWFRVPKETLEKVKADFKEVADPPPFNGIVPLIVFGDDAVKGYRLVQTLTGSISYEIEGWWRTDPVPPDEISNPDEPLGLHEFNAITSPSSPGSWNSFGLEHGDPIPREPCYIGIDCNKTPTVGWDGETDKPNVLRINIQLSDLGSGSGMGYTNSLVGPKKIVGYQGTNLFMTPTAGGTIVSMPYVLPNVGEAFVISEYNPVMITSTFADVSNVAFSAETERCIIKPDIEVVPDQWHHVLLSFDLSQPINASGRQYAGYDGYFPISPTEPKGNITTGCKIWLSYDDENIKGPTLLKGSFDASKSEIHSDNDLFTQNAANTAWQVNDVDHTIGPQQTGGFGVYVDISTVSGYTKPLYSYRCAGIFNGPLGVPAPTKYIDCVRHVEMAELQIFTGVTLDTGVEANRRAFIDYERDDNGKPVKDKDGNFTLIPVLPVEQPPTDDHPDGQPAPAEKLLKKKPEILLHGSGDWIDGKNTGTTGVDYSKDPPQEKPDGQFQPTGGINPYTPDPSLSKSPSSDRRKAGPVRLTKTPADARL